MSQNTLKTTSVLGEVRVSAGWDRQTGQLFCNILALDEPLEEDTDDEPDLPECFLRMAYGSVPDLIEALRAGGIELPRAMLSAIARDVQEGAGNVVRQFNADGSIASERRF